MCSVSVWSDTDLCRSIGTVEAECGVVIIEWRHTGRGSQLYYCMVRFFLADNVLNTVSFVTLSGLIVQHLHNR